MLSGYGFKKVYNLAGGIAAWNGLAAEGPVGLNLELIRGDETPEQMLRIAYGMEASVGHFYRTIKSMTPDQELGQLAERLATVEDKHKAFLMEHLRNLAGREEVGLAQDGADDSSVMEGGFKPEELIQKNRSLLESVPAMLDLSMMLETQALDLYLRFVEKSEQEETRKVLYLIADEEKQHLAALGRLRDERS
jgi:sulfur-carrier protein adenylyltransferase/sulfurtransferase